LISQALTLLIMGALFEEFLSKTSHFECVGLIGIGGAEGGGVGGGVWDGG
jgi:hypothetical protein